MWFWTGLYAEVEREMLINGVNTMLREAARLLLPKNTAGDRVKRVKSGDNDEDRSL
jgi:precorrin-4 methylase